MFDLEELQYLIGAVDVLRVNNTQAMRDKTKMLNRLCDVADKLAAEQEEKDKAG